MYQRLCQEFQKHQIANGMRPRTVRDYKFNLGYLFRFLEQNGISDIKEVNKQVLLDYQSHLYHELKTKDGKRLSLKSQANLIGVLTPFFKYLVMTDQTMYNPAEGISKPRLPKRIPRDILTEKEVKYLLTLPDLKTNEGFRARVLLEVLYSTGCRASEARNIKLNDIDLINRELFIIDGKGGKDRVVPITRPCSKFLEIYIVNQRTQLLKGLNSDYLFVGDKGIRFHKEKVCKIVRQYTTEAKFDKKITTHSLRHTCASHLLNKGASIRLIQELLGHESLNTTEKYTRVSIGDLKNALDKFHPRGGL